MIPKQLITLKLPYRQFLAVVFYDKDGTRFNNSKLIGTYSWVLDRVVQTPADAFIHEVNSEMQFEDTDSGEFLSNDIYENEVFPALTSDELTTFKFQLNPNYEYDVTFKLPSNRNVDIELNCDLFDSIPGLDSLLNTDQEYSEANSVKIWELVWNDTFHIGK